MKIYRIYNFVTGEYSTAGWYPRFKKNGKIFTTISGLKNHLRNILRHMPAYDKYIMLGESAPAWKSYNRLAIEKFLNKYYDNCYIVEYDLDRLTRDSYDINEFFNEFFYRKTR